MYPLIQSIAKYAESTFSKGTKEESFSVSLRELLNTINRITSADLNFNPDIVQSKNGAKCSAPVTCITIAENELFNMGIFLMQNGCKIPLHSHPDMHGIVKVIHGTVNYTSYSPVTMSADLTGKHDEIRNGTTLDIDTLIQVELDMSASLTIEDDACLLTPTEGNYHEISAVGGAAAIFDVLAPPYRNRRYCHYYSALESKGTDGQTKFWLSEIPVVAEYWNDSGIYTGPNVSL